MLSALQPDSLSVFGLEFDSAIESVPGSLSDSMSGSSSAWHSTSATRSEFGSHSEFASDFPSDLR